MTEAKQTIPHFYLTAEYELDGLLTHRAKLNEEDGVKVSVNDLIVWCVAQALIKEPRVNVNLVGDDIHQFSAANVSVAIATDEWTLFGDPIRRGHKIAGRNIREQPLNSQTKRKAAS